VDAQALRDSAYKSAQAALVEKFAPQIKEAVQKLLEQEEDPTAAGGAGMEGSPEDAMAGDIPAGTDFGGAPPDTSDKGYVAGTAKDIPLAATDGEKLCPCPDDDQEVTLELNLSDLADQLKVGREAEEEEESGMEPQMTGMMDQPQAAGGAGGPAPMMESLEFDEDLLDEELTEVNLDEILSEENFQEGKGKPRWSTTQHAAKAQGRKPEELEKEKEQHRKEVEKHKKKYSGKDLEESSAKDSGLRSAALDASYKATKQSSEEEKNKKDKEFRKANMKAKSERPDWMNEEELDEELDPVGEEDDDVDNDGDKDSSDEYLKNRRKAVSAAMKTNESKTKQLLLTSAQLLKEHQNSIKLMEKKDVQIQKLLDENKKFSSTIEEMSTAFKKLEEVNTLNARLFYENQVLKSASLNERQKTHIVEAISKADSVSEAKAMYETLINSVGGPQREERSPKSLNEAINKKSIFRLPHKQAEQPNDPNKDRWLKLAGIK